MVTRQIQMLKEIVIKEAEVSTTELAEALGCTRYAVHSLGRQLKNRDMVISKIINGKKYWAVRPKGIVKVRINLIRNYGEDDDAVNKLRGV